MTEACCPRPNAPPVLAPHGYPVEADGSVEARSVDGQQIFSYWVASSSNYTILGKQKRCILSLSFVKKLQNLWNFSYKGKPSEEFKRYSAQMNSNVLCCVDFNAFSPASSFASQSNKSRVAIKEWVPIRNATNRYWPHWPIGRFFLKMLGTYPTPNNFSASGGCPSKTSAGQTMQKLQPRRRSPIP